MSSNKEEGEPTLWNDDRTKYVIDRILSCYPKLSSGAKFDQQFRTEANMYVFVSIA